MRRRHILGMSAAGLFAPSVLRAQGMWPERPIRMIVPFPPGGSTDTIARILQPSSRRRSAPVVVENRGGGPAPSARPRPPAPRRTATLAARLRQRGDQPDGDAPLLPPDAGLRAGGPGRNRAAGHGHAPEHALEDLQGPGAAAKAAPDTISYATSGIGGLAHVSTTLLQQIGDFKLVHVPYRGGGPALQDVLSGQVPLFMSNG